MSFISVAFLVLLLVFMIIWPHTRIQTRTRWIVIAVASTIFYGWWDWRFLFLLIGSGLIDYLAALGMVRWPRMRKALLVVSVGMNVGSLMFFKYLMFLADQLSAFIPLPPPYLDFAHSIILPVGISFYTFQSMSYTIDVYLGHLKPVRSFLHFYAYLSMFPQLVAGPIVRAADLLPQLEHPGDFTAENRWAGCQRAVLGFFKKMVIADNIAPIVNDAFSNYSPEAGALFWLAVSGLFAIQIYCDFSGYSDIACGLARWMGYRFPENFNHPYLAIGFRDFWSRWHITLSTWFRDYVYVPLGGNRRKMRRNAFNLWFTMIVSGFWHGANWTFVIWGALHAAFLSIERIWKWPERASHSIFGKLVGMGITLTGVLIAWIYFRAETLQQAWGITRTFGVGPWGGVDPLLKLVNPSAGLACLFFIAMESLAFTKTHLGWFRSTPVPAYFRFATVTLAIVVSVFLRGNGGDFIYFQF